MLGKITIIFERNRKRIVQEDLKKNRSFVLHFPGTYLVIPSPIWHLQKKSRIFGWLTIQTTNDSRLVLNEWKEEVVKK